MYVDVVLYGGEFDLLKARLKSLNADVTVVVEGDRQFRGQYKGWTLEDRLDELPGNVVYLPIASTEFPNPWHNEYHQRNAPMDELRKMNLPDDAVVGWFDADEFPDPQHLQEAEGLSAWRMAKHQLSAFWFQQYELTGITGSWKHIADSDMAQMRRVRDRLPKINAGYHLSSFGTLADTIQKWEGFSHYELWRPDMESWVTHCWSNGVAIENGQDLTQVDKLPDDFPQYLRDRKGPPHWYRGRQLAP